MTKKEIYDGDRSHSESQENIQVFLLMVRKIQKSFLEKNLSSFYSWRACFKYRKETIVLPTSKADNDKKVDKY